MTNAPPPATSDAEIVEALEALAVENDEVDAVVSGGEHRAPLLRLAASRLAALAAENERMREALETQDDGLHQIERWAEAYPVSVFLPLTDADIKRAGVLLQEAGISMDGLHAGWARHILTGIADICRRARSAREQSK